MTPVDDALDRLVDYAGWATTPKSHKDAVATVRDALKQARDERDEAVEAYEAQAEFGGKQLAEVRGVQSTLMKALENSHGLEAQVRRLTEGLREIANVASGYVTVENRNRIGEIARALLADSPPEP